MLTIKNILGQAKQQNAAKQLDSTVPCVEDRWILLGAKPKAPLQLAPYLINQSNGKTRAPV